MHEAQRPGCCVSTETENRCSPSASGGTCGGDGTHTASRIASVGKGVGGGQSAANLQQQQRQQLLRKAGEAASVSEAVSGQTTGMQRAVRDATAQLLAMQSQLASAIIPLRARIEASEAAQSEQRVSGTPAPAARCSQGQGKGGGSP